MIGRISGRVDYRTSDHVLVDVQGIGYLVYCSEPTLAALPPGGGAVVLYTDLLVREDNLQLFGFLTTAEREWYKLLMSVQGVGARAALAIVGTLGVDGVSLAITLGDMAAIRAAPGVGPKLARRIAVELKGKAARVIAPGSQGAEAAGEGDSEAVENPVPAAPVQQMAQADALSALVNLGYGHGDAAAAVARAAGDVPRAGTSELIKAALQALEPEQ
ncbi:MAG: Holliday junction branch migration protein RuvA [Rhodobacteraceae bacterium]|nr:Holliday junction branch migration protein RuvA [Paracoccaceae bacterium]